MHVNKKVRRPSGAFPSLPAGMDKILKEHFDDYRKRGVIPKELEGKFNGKLYPDLESLDVWRNNRKGLRFTDEKSGMILMGALDDLYVTKNGLYAPLDFKTRGYPLKDDTHEHYQHQMDIYSYLLEKNSMKPAGYAILIFYHPKCVTSSCNVEFNADPLKVKTIIKNGEKIFLDAIQCLSGKEPKGSCIWCKNI
ncbi:MAG: hypothetical protein ABIJ92_02440 [Candidatus Aenigmatarchaeota archaeon]